ncbi:MAG: hypothetical protein WCC45_00030 [Paeniglutamicibacter sp.]|nr:hypothetical protein [Arthrobacter sp. UCD-GKA]
MSKIRNTFQDSGSLLNGITMASGHPPLLDTNITGRPIGLGSKARSYLI